MSTALWIGEPPAVLKWIYPNSATQKVTDPIAIAGNKTVQIPVDMIEGDHDPFIDADQFLYQVLKSHRVNAAYHEYSGGHDDSFWRTHVDEMLLYVDRTSE